jgi:hypothetical protein
MFGRFRKTNDPARENDGGAVAVSERDEPATSVAAPSNDPAARGRRLEELRATQADDPDTRGLDRDRVVATDRTDTERDRVAATDRTDTERDGVAATDRTDTDRQRVAATDETATDSDRFARTERAPVVAREPATDRDVDDEPRTVPAVVAEDTVLAMRARQRDRFGGIRWGSAFFGLLSAIGLAAILLGIAAAAGVAFGLSEINDVRQGNADTIGLGGAILLLAILALSWYCGGYVAGRMARFDGVRQGIGVWAWTLAIGAALAIAAVIGGSDYNVLQQLNLPNVAVGDQSLTTGGWLTLVAAVVVTLVFAIVGGKAGDLFHRRVDRFATRDYVETA